MDNEATTLTGAGGGSSGSFRRAAACLASAVLPVWLALAVGPAGPVGAMDAAITWTLPPSPTTVTVTAGENVTWSGNLTFHPLITTDPTFTTVGVTLASSGAAFTQNFPAPGTFHFMCGVHGSFMPTTVTVAPACPSGPYALLDIDGNGTVDALTDGLLLLRYAFGLRGAALIAGAIGACASRSTATDIESYLATRVVP